MNWITAKEKLEVKSGFRFVGNFFLGILFAGMVLSGLIGLLGREPSRFGTLGSLVLLCCGIAALYFTGHRWKRWIAGFFAFWGVFNGAIMLFSGHQLNNPNVPISRMEAGLAMSFWAAVLILTCDFAGQKTKTDTIDRVLLVIATVSILATGVRKSSELYLLAVSLVALGLLRLRIAKVPSKRSDAKRTSEV
ncbi:MAG: hypothetical protein HYX26_09145 [Acidobacteriales bacterium]|nr:hypothetical protein [Terriglobales bacterium]